MEKLAVFTEALPNQRFPRLAQVFCAPPPASGGYGLLRAALPASSAGHPA